MASSSLDPHPENNLSLFSGANPQTSSTAITTIPNFKSKPHPKPTMAATTIPTIKPASGKLIPALGFGTGTAWYKSEKDPLNRELIDSIKSAIANGYRHLDCAEAYGTEPEAGGAIKESRIPRDELYITTKVFVDSDSSSTGKQLDSERNYTLYTNR